MRYKAFISYSHAADGKLAPDLEKALERFAKPWNRTRAFDVERVTRPLTEEEYRRYLHVEKCPG
jgi:hypothetical protein